MQTPTNQANTAALTAHLELLTDTVTRIRKITSATNYENVTLMASVKSRYRHDYEHLMIAWKRDLAFPRGRAIAFLSGYCSDLEKQISWIRRALATDPRPLLVEKDYWYPCVFCETPTLHRNYIRIPADAECYVQTDPGQWICNECDTVFIQPNF